MANITKNTYHTYFLIESHPTSLGKNVILSLDMKHKATQPITKILEKEFKLADGKQDYLVSVYTGDIIKTYIKDNEIPHNQNGIKTFQVKTVLKAEKNKFELKINPYIDFDTFLPYVKFEPMKKIVGKPIEPPEQINLTPFNFISLFSEALTISLQKQPNDPTIIEFLKFSLGVIKTFQKIPFKLFLLIYIKILHSQNMNLISSILQLYIIENIEEPKTQEEIIINKDPLMTIFKNQNIYLDIIRKIDSNSFNINLSKFYHIIILYFYLLNDISSIEEIMIDLRDNNNYDKLILAKLYLEDTNNFYRNIQISQEIKISLMEKFLEASNSYKDLLTSFSMIREYIDGDLNQIISIIIKYYEKINIICYNRTNVIKLNDYIKPKKTDNLDILQDNLTNFGKIIMKYKYKPIFIQIYTWEIYLDMETNPQFLEFISSYLIQVSSKYVDIIEALNFITNYLKKDMEQMMKLFVKNYDKLENICKNEKRFINALGYFEPNLNDNLDSIKNNLDFIVSRRLKSNYEIINFPIKIWLFYINDVFSKENILHIEKKLLEQASHFDNIIDCLTFASTLRQKKFIELLRFVIENFEKISTLTKLNDKHIDFSKYYQIDEKEDNIEIIYELINQLIDLEINNNFRTFDFPIKIWQPYSTNQNLEYLRTIRKIIVKLKEMDSSLDEDVIELPRKIHDIGYIYIGEGKLKGEELIEFLSNEEYYYNEKLMKNLMEVDNNQQKQIDTNIYNIKRLEDEFKILIEKANSCEKELQELKVENNNLGTKAVNLENNVYNLVRRINNN